MRFITFSSRPLSDYSETSIRRQPMMMNESHRLFGVPLENLWQPEMQYEWTGEFVEPHVLRFLDTLPDDEIVLGTDSWDVFFSGTPAEMEAAFLTFDRPIVVSTEANLWPPETAHLMHHPPAPTRFRYACGGGWAARAWAMRKLLTAPDWWPEPFCCNQSAFDDWYCRHPELTTLDFHCRLFQCMYDDGKQNPPLGSLWEIKNQRFHNKETDSYPMVIHGGGGFCMEALNLWLRLKEARGWL